MYNNKTYVQKDLNANYAVEVQLCVACHITVCTRRPSIMRKIMRLRGHIIPRFTRVTIKAEISRFSLQSEDDPNFWGNTVEKFVA